MKKALYLSLVLILLLPGCNEEGTDTTSNSFSNNSGSSSSNYAGTGSFCAYNYSKDACNILCSNNSNTYSTCTFNEGSGSGACGSYTYDSEYDYGYTGGGYGDAVGACIVTFNSSSSYSNSSNSYTSNGSNSNTNTSSNNSGSNTNNSNSNSNTNTSSNNYSCSNVPSGCVSATASWSQYSDDTLTVRYTNNCGVRVYARFCNKRIDGSEDCGASGISAGGSHNWTTHNANGEYDVQYIGVSNPSDDWVCASNTPGWYN